MSIVSGLENAYANFHRDHVKLKLDDIQAFIFRSRPLPYTGAHALVNIDDAASGRDLLAYLKPHISSASDWKDDLKAWGGIGISFQGLKALGVPESSLRTFPDAFQQGMAARAALLEDVGINAPRHWESMLQPGQCHIAISFFAEDDASLDETARKIFAEIRRKDGVKVLGTHEFCVDADGQNPFGFRDSISQPIVAGSGVIPQPGQERHIAAGEFILGEPSETGESLAVPQPPVLGLNGTYAVFRKYISHVGAFNDFTKEHAGVVGSADLLAAKMIGRWRSGAPIVLSPHHDDKQMGSDVMRNNDFDFSDDESGLKCPFSSHVRRNNPRNSALTVLTDVHIHRIIRRSSTFGPKWTPELTTTDDRNHDRGIIFIFISARAFSTIEFAHREWINKGNFIDLGKECDPIIGVSQKDRQFTIPGEPARHRLRGLPAFNTVRGGEYLFMPSLSGIEWLVKGNW